MKLQISSTAQTTPRWLTGMIQLAGRPIVDLLYPPRCVLCYGVPEAVGYRLCLDCRYTIDAERQRPSCPTCAASVAPYEVSEGRCSECRGRPVRSLGSVRIGHYRGRLAHLVQAYKYARREELEPVLGGWLVEAIEAAPWRDRVEAVAPVPTHWRRRITRPYYPAERLAAFVARAMTLPCVAILRRVRCGPRQVGLSYTARIENMRGVFALRRGVGLHHARLLIIDDVRTTGATIDECAKVLRASGTSEVYAATAVKAGWIHALGGPLSAI